MEIRFEIPGKPMGKQRPRVCNKGNFSHAYTPKETADYEDLVRQYFSLSARGQDVTKLYEKPLCVTILACYEPPKAFTQSKRSKALNGTVRPVVKPDLDNIAKIVCDALNKAAYKDDAQIVRLFAEKQYATHPCVIVSIEEIEG